MHFFSQRKVGAFFISIALALD